MLTLELHPDLGGDHWAAAQVNAAYACLGDPARRAAYDRELLAHHDVATLSRGPLPEHARHPSDRATAAGGQAWHHAARNRSGAYDLIVTRYCPFCRTPHHASPAALDEAPCVECASPLGSPRIDSVDQPRRAVECCPRSEVIGIYKSWPGTRLSGRLLDLSPTGLRFTTPEACEIGDLIKIDARWGGAVGTVVHRHRDRAVTTAGIKFHTVGFAVTRGGFVSERA